MKTKKIFICGTILLSACNPSIPHKDVVITEFPIKKEIKASVIQTAPEILAPEQLFILNDQIWLYQGKKDLLFDVFNLHDCSYLFSTGKKGQGPDEFIFPMGTTIQIKNNHITIFDNFVMKTVEVLPDNSLHTIKSDKIFDRFPVNGFVKLNDSLYCAFADCATGTTGVYEYRLKNNASKEEVKFSDYPNLTEKKYEGDQRCQIYYKYLVSNPSQGKFAAFYAYFKYFRIYNISGKLEKEIHVNINPYQTDNVEDWEKREIYYGRAFATEKYIYAPCSADEIQVWDWNGIPIIQYFLDKEFFTFAVSEEEQKLYVVSAGEEDLDKFFVYDLSH
ncbi:hypothetical protein AGMMS50239_24800 [Bacteroidia bacterium]|nr:hypothetical protein AGMMS50239_24800 [Bacteroidia bacterium]